MKEVSNFEKLGGILKGRVLLLLVISFLVFSVVSVHSLDFTEVIPVPQIDVTKPVEGEVIVALFPMYRLHLVIPIKEGVASCR
jgi:hypothetical protein